MTNNKQQTAVQWFIEQLNSKYGGDDFLITHINEIEKAKEMHKKESIAFALHYTFGHQEVSDQIKNNLEKLYNQYFEGDK